MSWHIREAIRHIAAGGVIACPTETVYGLSCDPFNAAAVLHLLELKGRAVHHGLILIASSVEQLEPLLQPLKPQIRQRIDKTWPGPVTWTLPCLPEIPVWLRGMHETLAVRVTSHPVANALCECWGGPLVSTSANLHGRRSALSPLDVRRCFDARLDYILHNPARAAGIPSEIRDGFTGQLLRHGPAG